MNSFVRVFLIPVLAVGGHWSISVFYLNGLVYNTCNSCSKYFQTIQNDKQSMIILK